MFEDGTPGELFVTMAKEGSTISGLMDAFATPDLLRPPVRRAAEVHGRQVQPHALRALGVHQEPGDPDRQVDRGLHLPLDGEPLPADRGAGRGRASSAAIRRPSRLRPLPLLQPPSAETQAASSVTELKVIASPTTNGNGHGELCPEDRIRQHRRPGVPGLRGDHRALGLLLQVPELRSDDRLQLRR